MVYPFEDASLRIDIDDFWNKASYSDADTYFAARGTSTWTGENAVKSQALERAWDYLKTLNWVDDVFAISQPVDITNAHILLALEELQDPNILTPALTRDDYLESKGIGNGAIEKVYRSNAPAWKRFRGVEMLLSPYVTSSVNVRLERG